MVISASVHAAIMIVPLDIATGARQEKHVVIVMDIVTAEAGVDSLKMAEPQAKPPPPRPTPKPERRKPPPQPIVQAEPIKKRSEPRKEVPEPTTDNKQPEEPEPQEEPQIIPEPAIDNVQWAPETDDPSPEENMHSVPAPTAPSSDSRQDAEPALSLENGRSGSASAPQQMKFGSGTGPRFLRRILPEYPRKARRLGIEGRVILRIAIDATGRLEKVEVVQHAGHGFEEEAVRAVRQSTYRAVTQNGKPVACEALLPIRFELRK
jgi:protein TonB